MSGSFEGPEFPRGAKTLLSIVLNYQEERQIAKLKLSSSLHL